MTESVDPDLPGDETFRALPPVVEKVIPIRCDDCPEQGRCETCGGPRGAIAIAMTISPEAQAAQHHNRLRYAELQKARLGLSSEYARTRYRH